MIPTKDNLELFTQVWPAPKAKAVVVLNPGLDDRSARYEHVGQAFNAGGYTLFSYDFRGQGQSGGVRGHTPSYTQLLDDLELAIAAAKKLEPHKKVFLYGHSMGGNIVLNYGLRRPAGLSGVIATAPQLRLAFTPPPIKVWLGKIIGALLPTFSQNTNLDVNTISRDEAVKAAYLANPDRNNIITAKLFFEVLAAAEYALAHAAEFKLPLLLLHGGSDGLVDPCGSEEFIRQVNHPDKTFKSFAGLYHEIHNEPEKQTVFNEMIAWLDTH